MAQGNEIHFGFANTKDTFDAAKRFDLEICDLNSGVISYDDFLANQDITPDIDVKGFRSALVKAYENTLDRLGWKWELPKRPDQERFRIVNSPWGRRQSAIWDLEVEYDPDENGDSVDDLTFGVNLSGRYFPVILDTDNFHGGIPNSFAFTRENVNIIETCKQEIIKAIPEMKHGVVFIRSIYY